MAAKLNFRPKTTCISKNTSTNAQALWMSVPSSSLHYRRVNQKSNEKGTQIIDVQEKMCGFTHNACAFVLVLLHLIQTRTP